MTTFCAADTCRTPVTSTTLCKPCRETAEQILAETPWLIDEVRNAYTRQSRFGQPRSRSKALVTPLLVNLSASNVASRIATVLDTWQSRAADHLGEPVRHPSPVASGHYLLRALTDHRLNAWADAGKMLDDLKDIRRDALRVINPPPDKWAAGPCNAPDVTPDGQPGECGAGLYATVGAPTVTCDKCAAEYDVADRRAWLLKNADDEQVTITVAVRALVTLSDDAHSAGLLHQRIRQWAHRNQLMPKRHAYEDSERYALYRFGDIRDLLATAARRDQERQLAKDARKAGRAC